MIHLKESINLEYVPQTSRPAYTLEQLPEEPELQEPEYSAWDYIQDAVRVGLFFTAGVCTGTLLSILVVVGR